MPSIEYKLSEVYIRESEHMKRKGRWRKGCKRTEEGKVAGRQETRRKRKWSKQRGKLGRNEEKSRKQEEGKVVGSSTGRRRRIREQVERMKEEEEMEQ